MLSLHLPGPRTPLYPLIQQRVIEAAQPIFERLQAWRMMNTGPGLSTTDIRGKPVRYSSVKFEGSPRVVFWSGFFEPFLAKAARESLQWTIDCCRERHLDAGEYLTETRDLLALLVERVYEYMARTDQLLRGEGFPNSVAPKNVSSKIEAMKGTLDDLVVALTHKGTPESPPPADIHLEPSQIKLLVDLVEASRRQPDASQSEFQALTAAQMYPAFHVRHPGLPADYRATLADLQELEATELIRLRSNSKGDILQFSVRPKGVRFYAEVKRQAGTPINRTEGEIRRLFDQQPFQDRFSAAYQKWALAERLLWGADSQDQLTAIGHYCREAMQQFASALVALHQVADANPSSANTVARLRAVIRARVVGETLPPFLDALVSYWGTVSDLVQRQEHGAQRESRAVTWEDARRVVFQTMCVMYEVDRALNDDSPR